MSGKSSGADQRLPLTAAHWADKVWRYAVHGSGHTTGRAKRHMHGPLKREEYEWIKP